MGTDQGVRTVVEAVRFGGPDVLVARETARDAPGPGEVAVDVEVAEVLFLDTQLRAGWGVEWFAQRPPFVPGTGVGGTVAAVGEGVDPSLVGRRVVARTGNDGGYATHAIVASDEVYELPASVRLGDAMAALHDAPTALSKLEHARIQPGEHVLVTAAAGSLGAWFVPLAKAAGAKVIGAARGDQKLDAVRALGADVAVDYGAQDWTARVAEATGGEGVDVVFDGSGGALGRSAFASMAAGGRFYAYGAASGDVAPVEPEEAAERGVALVGILDIELSPDDWRRLTHLGLEELATGAVTAVIGQTVALERAADAHAAIAARTVIGKSLLSV
jgi:NADPH2:quinone reductase